MVLHMRDLMEKLLALQSLEFGGRKTGKETERARLRAEIPEPILGHFDRLVARGKKGVAVIRRGVCTECHLRVPLGNLLVLAKGTDIQICGNCGRYLQLPEEEKPGQPARSEPAVAAPKAASRRGRKRRDAELAVV
jgi:predicted  nucleic acid-binding Zn-ribbon protein